MASKKASTKKKRNEPDSAAETLDAIEGWGDRLAESISNNPAPILIGAVVVLVVAAIAGFTGDYLESGSTESAAALGRVQGAYRAGMGATPGSLELPEPANPETARRLRTEAIEGYETVAVEHPGTPAAALSWLQAGRLQGELGDREAEVAAYDQGLAEVSSESGIGAFLLVQKAAAQEEAGRFAEAAESYQAAANIPGNPLRMEMLSQAARCWAHAGLNEQAGGAYDQLQAEAPDYLIPPYTEARLKELGAAAGSN